MAAFHSFLLLLFFELVLCQNDRTSYYETMRKDPRAIYCSERDDGSSFKHGLSNLTALQYHLHQNDSLSHVLVNGEPTGDYQNATMLCAATPYGGHRLSNMGAFCDRSYPSVPRLGFALDIGDSRLYDLGFLRHTCRSSCKCLPADESTALELIRTVPIPDKIPLLAAIANSVRNKQNVIRQGRSVASVASMTYNSYFDPNEIWCHDQMPGLSIQTILSRALPENHFVRQSQKQSHQNITSLCAAVPFGGLPEGNLGAHCRRPTPKGRGLTHLIFGPLTGMGVFDGQNGSAATQIQYLNWPDWTLRDSKVLRRLCEMRCFCGGMEDGGVVGEIAPKIRDYTSEEIDSLKIAWERGYAARQTSSPVVSSDESLRTKACQARQTCKNFRCDGTDEPGCKCFAKKFNNDTAQFEVVGCGLTSAAEHEKLPVPYEDDTIGRRRTTEESGGFKPPCPCNGTYVSHLCCDSISKIVWESPRMKLGELHFSLR
ncbi:MAG: hypothetical protein M1814_004138 [Vezdaea aestivalis]|nr:MAG: hypothetical protein M1814_004138 [Vezdaea aestivalis]